MSRIRFSAVVVIASMLLATMPAGLLAADNAPPVPGIRASIDRAVAKTLADQPPAPPASFAKPRASASVAQGGGGGAGKAMAVIAIVSAVGGLAATYYIVKQMQKQSNTNPNGQ